MVPTAATTTATSRQDTQEATFITQAGPRADIFQPCISVRVAWERYFQNREVSERLVRKLLDSGELAACNIAGKRLIVEQSIVDYLEKAFDVRKEASTKEQPPTEERASPASKTP